MKSEVALVQSDKLGYPEGKVFNPHQAYPEYPYPGEAKFSKNNQVYESVRELLRLLKMDIEHYGSKDWNPLGKIISPGDQVIIKPNFVGIKPLYVSFLANRSVSVNTHASVLRPLIDYAFIAAGPKGKILIAEATMSATNLEEVLKATATLPMVEYLQTRHKVPVEIIDLRDTIEERWSWKTKPIKGPRHDYVKIDLADKSELDKLYKSKVDFELQAPADHKQKGDLPNQYHRQGKNEYFIPRIVLETKAIINVPKLKTHKKAGVTLSLKSFMGLTARRDTIPHNRRGSPPEGDAHPYPPQSIMKYRHSVVDALGKIPFFNKLIIQAIAFGVNGLKKIIPGFGRIIEDGDWYGNDTLWRSLIDLNKIMFYADKNGILQNVPQRKILSIIDGVIGGEGYGPMYTGDKKSGVLAGGMDSVAVDTVCTRLMGFDHQKIPTIKNTAFLKEYKLGTANLSNIEVCSNCAKWDDINLAFEPPYDWKGHIERDTVN